MFNNCNSFVLIIGERRKVFFNVCASDGVDEAFAITNATYELADSSGEIVYEGVAVINEDDIICTIQPPTIGTYLLTCTCNVGDEIIKGTATIKVGTKK